MHNSNHNLMKSVAPILWVLAAIAAAILWMVISKAKEVPQNIPDPQPFAINKAPEVPITPCAPDCGKN